MDLSGLIVRASLTADHAVCVGARLGDSAVFQVTDLDEDWQRLRLARNGAQTMLAVEQTHLAVSCHADFDVSALEKMAFGNVLQNFLDLMFIERALLNCSGSVPAGPAPALVSELFGEGHILRPSLESRPRVGVRCVCVHKTS